MTVTADLNLAATDPDEIRQVLKELDTRMELEDGILAPAIRNIGLAVKANEPEVAARWLAVANTAQAEHVELHAAWTALHDRLVGIVTGVPHAIRQLLG